jgi:hypothetical protein
MIIRAENPHAQSKGVLYLYEPALLIVGISSHSVGPLVLRFVLAC